MATLQIHLQQQLYRLAWLEEHLATDGVCANHAARELDTNARTIRRDLDFLHELCPLVYEQERHGRRRWYYADCRKRIFSKWFTREAGA